MVNSRNLMLLISQ